MSGHIAQVSSYGKLPCAAVSSLPLGYFGGIAACSKAGVLLKRLDYLKA